MRCIVNVFEFVLPKRKNEYSTKSSVLQLCLNQITNQMYLYKKGKTQRCLGLFTIFCFIR